MRAPRVPLGTMQSNASRARSQQISNMKPAGVQAVAREPSSATLATGPKRWKMRDFEIGRKLGRGKFGRVLLVRVKESGFVCALKLMKKEELVKYHAEVQFQREVEIQASLHHPNILQIYGYFHDSKNVYIMVEFAAKGELYAILGECGRFTPDRASNYICQVAAGLEYCHQRNILHRDIKPENLLMGVDGTIKISDFGWSVRSRHTRGTLCGTLDYLPPEMIENEQHHHYVDIWALGVLTYEFLTGEAPFYSEGRKLTYQRIKKVDLKFPSYIEPEAADFISALLQRDPAKRMHIGDVPSHPWMQKHKAAWKTLYD